MNASAQTLYLWRNNAFKLFSNTHNPSTCLSGLFLSVDNTSRALSSFLFAPNIRDSSSSQS